MQLVFSILLLMQHLNTFHICLTVRDLQYDLVMLFTDASCIRYIVWSNSHIVFAIHGVMPQKENQSCFIEI
jgi:hypothetical protein